MQNLLFLVPAGLGFSPDPRCSVCPGMVLSSVEWGGSLSGLITRVLQFGKILFFFFSILLYLIHFSTEFAISAVMYFITCNFLGLWIFIMVSCSSF